MVHSTFGWSVSNVPLSLAVNANPLQQRLVNFTATANKKAPEQRGTLFTVTCT